MSKDECEDRYMVMDAHGSEGMADGLKDEWMY